MGSWYNLEGESLANCITMKCGMMPFPPIGLSVSPQKTAEYNAKKSAWIECKNKCQGSIIGTSIRVPSPSDTGEIVSSHSENADQPTENGIASGISPNMKMGLIIGAVAVIGFLIFFKRR